MLPRAHTAWSRTSATLQRRRRTSGGIPPPSTTARVWSAEPEAMFVMAQHASKMSLKPSFGTPSSFIRSGRPPWARTWSMGGSSSLERTRRTAAAPRVCAAISPSFARSAIISGILGLGGGGGGCEGRGRVRGGRKGEGDESAHWLQHHTITFSTLPCSHHNAPLLPGQSEVLFARYTTERRVGRTRIARIGARRPGRRATASASRQRPRKIPALRDLPVTLGLADLQARCRGKRW